MPDSLAEPAGLQANTVVDLWQTMARTGRAAELQRELAERLQERDRARRGLEEAAARSAALSEDLAARAQELDEARRELRGLENELGGMGSRLRRAEATLSSVRGSLRAAWKAMKVKVSRRLPRRRRGGLGAAGAAP
ncbi:unnamed protein product [Prorocentrum cordatum]|uniref:Uncharacterized protein n=1 Tax=Prorocentrum cordatum TaxID=2364126 RepID=A0ABN9TG34_9DINO|nr:unnamed protein product [Polarella glacialis]